MPAAATANAGRVRLSGMNVLVEEILGADDDGKVMRVADKNDPGSRYALKVVSREEPKDDGRLARCRASAEASAKLGHPAILKYHDYRDRKSWFRVVRGELLMEYVAGKSLDRLERPLQVGHWIVVFKHVTGAIAHMHRRGVLHGDITPGRIVLGNSGAVKVIGYGQSLLRDEAHRTTTKQFAAPEQARSKALDEKTEVYAAGALMYFLLTGKTPNALRHAGDDAAVKIPRPSALNPKVPAGLDAIILPCVQRQPSSRPEGMFDVLKGLEDLAKALELDDAILALSARAREE